jgi:hypothetical protein
MVQQAQLHALHVAPKDWMADSRDRDTPNGLSRQLNLARRTKQVAAFFPGKPLVPSGPLFQLEETSDLA